MGDMVSGEIKPSAFEEKDDEKQRLEEDIKALEMRRDATAKNYQEALKRIKEIQTNPGSNFESMQEANLELLNILQKEVDNYKEIHAQLERQIDELKLKK